jgi:hypothetical protein
MRSGVSRLGLSLAKGSFFIIVFALATGWAVSEGLSLVVGLWVGFALAWGAFRFFGWDRAVAKYVYLWGIVGGSACVGRAVCRRCYGFWRDTRYPSGDNCLLDGLWARPGRCASSRRNRQTSPRRGGVALYCHCSIKKREVSSNETRRYLDCVRFGHSGSGVS